MPGEGSKSIFVHRKKGTRWEWDCPIDELKIASVRATRNARPAPT